jgi:hypothetical protein
MRSAVEAHWFSVRLFVQKTGIALEKIYQKVSWEIDKDGHKYW